MGQQTEHVPAQCNALTRLYLLSYGSAGADLGGGGGGGGGGRGGGTGGTCRSSNHIFMLRNRTV